MDVEALIGDIRKVDITEAEGRPKSDETLIGQCYPTTASQYSNTFCCRCHKGEVYIMLQDITSTLILGQYF